MSSVAPSDPKTLDRWLQRLQERHLATLTFQEVRKGLQAVSRLYVQKRDRLGGGAVFDGAGKRAAFALFYGPIHLMTVQAIVSELNAVAPRRIVDLGCGTGVGGAAWALATPTGQTAIEGVDLSHWATREAERNYRDLGLKGRAKTGDLLRTPLGGDNTGIIAAYTINELPALAREKLRERLFEAWRRGATLLIAEPIARKPVPWWDDWSRQIKERGGREDEWDLPWTAPALLARLDRAAGLNHRSLKARTFFLTP